MDRAPVAQWIDISVPLRGTMVHWPGDPPVRIERIQDVSSGDSSTLSGISMTSHSGTHIDSPFHFLPSGLSIDRMPLDTTIGRARVIEVKNSRSIMPEDLVPHRIRQNERILFKTLNSSRAWKSDSFMEDYVFISESAARFLVARGVRLVGVDYLSVGSFGAGGGTTHRILLGGGVWLLESLDLSRVPPGNYELVCLPLRLEGADGAPARAVVRAVKVAAGKD